MIAGLRDIESQYASCSCGVLTCSRLTLVPRDWRSKEAPLTVDPKDRERGREASHLAMIDIQDRVEEVSLYFKISESR